MSNNTANVSENQTTQKAAITPQAAQSPAAQPKIPRRILSALMTSLSAGVVPRSGAPYVAIGRKDEIEALLSDLEKTAEGGSAMRFIIGRYGSGKSFLIQLMRGYALERGFITADADLSTERRLCGTNGSGLATYRELMRNLASKASPDGGALPQIMARWLSDVKTDVAASGLEPGSEAFTRAVRERIYTTVRNFESSVGGFDFARVAGMYFDACENGNDECKSACMRYLRGEFTTKTEAKSQLPGIGAIIDDDNWYDYIKLIARLVSAMGYRGLVVFIDECVNLYKISNRISRENNYEKLLTMFNDTLQGRAENLMIVMGGTPQFLEDRRRGLFSYEALRSRLSDGRFDTGEYKNMIGPVTRLRRLSDNELLALILRVTSLHALYYNWEPRIAEGDPERFLSKCLEAAGADIMITPREMIRDYISVLNILYQNPNADFATVVGTTATLKPSTEDIMRESENEIDTDKPDAQNERPRSNFTPDDIII